MIDDRNNDIHDNMNSIDNQTNIANSINADSIDRINTGICEATTPSVRALALQSLSRNCYPAPDFELRKPLFLIHSILLRRSVCFTDTGIPSTDTVTANGINSSIVLIALMLLIVMLEARS